MNIYKLKLCRHLAMSTSVLNNNFTCMSFSFYKIIQKTNKRIKFLDTLLIFFCIIIIIFLRQQGHGLIKYETKMHNSLVHFLRKSSCLLITLRGLSSRKKEFADSKIVGFTREQMFEVVADVENYEKFIPFCLKSIVTRKSDSESFGILEVGFPPLIESYTSKVTLVRPYLVKADCTDGKLFHHLTTTWRFNEVPKTQKTIYRNSCKVNFYLSFEFKSLLHSQLANLFFDQLVLQMQAAFFQEAHRRYGTSYLTSNSDAPT